MLNKSVEGELQALKPIVSPINQALSVSLFEGVEGLSMNTQCSIYETRLRWKDLAQQFESEANSDLVGEEFKHQRDVSANDTRVKGIRNYLETRTDTLFPGIIIFVNNLDITNSIELNNGDRVLEANIPSDAHRLICDGQGRFTTVSEVLKSHPEWNDFTIGAKIICTNTSTLNEASSIIRQTFSDVNGHTLKPNTSLSMYFDTAKPFSRMIKEIIESDITVNGSTSQLRNLISLNGSIKKGQLWTLKQFSDSFPVLFGSTPKALNESLEDSDLYESTKQVGVEFYRRILSQLPLEELFVSDNKQFNDIHKRSMFTKALFSKALGYVGRSLYEESINSEQPIDWSKLDKLATLPLDTIESEVWIKSQVSWCDDSKGFPIVKIHKSSDKKIARVLCQACRIFPTLDI